MKMAKKGFKFSKDLIFLMGGLVIVLGILFYVLGYKVREGFAGASTHVSSSNSMPDAAKAALSAGSAWDNIANNSGDNRCSRDARSAANAWKAAATTLTTGSASSARSASDNANAACAADDGPAAAVAKAAQSLTTTALGLFQSL